MESMCEIGTNFKKFCWKHRCKIGIGAVALAGGIALYYYLQENDSDSTTGSENDKNGNPSARTTNNPNHEDELSKNSHEERKTDQISTDLTHGESKEQQLQLQRHYQQQDDGRLLTAVHQLYGFAISYFLPNIRTRLKDLIDVSETIQRLKNLKNDHTDESRDMKVSLWNHIKISSFTSLFATIYSLSAVAILLHVQMHILVRDTIKITHTGLNDHQPNQEEDIFRALFEGSYTVFFGSGLERLVKWIKEVVILQVSEWSVESQLNVEYYDVIETIGTIRKDLEGDTSKLLHLLMFPAPTPHTSEIELKPAATPLTPPLPPTDDVNSPSSSIMLQSLIEETCTVVTSPVFLAAYEETLQTIFHHIQELLRIQAFNSPETAADSSNLGASKNLPLASLLPKVKSITARLIPDDLGRNPQSLLQLKSITNGPQVSALCSRIFSSPHELKSHSSQSKNSNLPKPQIHIDSPLPFPQKKGSQPPFQPIRDSNILNNNSSVGGTFGCDGEGV